MLDTNECRKTVKLCDYHKLSNVCYRRYIGMGTAFILLKSCPVKIRNGLKMFCYKILDYINKLYIRYHRYILLDKHIEYSNGSSESLIEKSICLQLFTI